MTDRIELREFVDILRRAQRNQYLPGLIDGVCDAAAAHLDAIDPEREAKVERALDDLLEAQRYYEQHPRRQYLESRDIARDACVALLRPAPPSPSVVAEKIVRDVAELPDRDSPEDWPEAMLVTGDELRAIVLAALAISNANARGGDDV